MSDGVKDIMFELMGWVLTPLGVALAWGGRRLWRRAVAWSRARRALARVVAALLLGLAVPSLVLGGYGLWVRYRPRPDDTRHEPFTGVVVRTFSRDEPRPIVVHVATVDLDAPGVELVLTPAAHHGCLPAATTSTFLAQQRVQLAINTQFFFPCPGVPAPDELEPGQPLRPVGRYAVDGEWVVERRWEGNTIFIDERGEVTLYDEPARVHHAVSGRHRLVEAGQGLEVDDGLLAPRIAIGFDASRRHMTIVLVDGRQRGYSEGLSLPELVDLLLELQVHDAIELDGGGSATLVIEGEDGQPQVVSSPIHTRIPGRERPVANHLGVRAVRAGG